MKNLANIYTEYVDVLFTYGTNLGFDKEIVKDSIHDIFVKIALDNTILSSVDNIKFYLLKSLKNKLFETLFGPNWRIKPGGTTGLTEQLSGCMLIESIAQLQNDQYIK